MAVAYGAKLHINLYRSFLKMLNIACSQNAKYFVRIVY